MPPKPEPEPEVLETDRDGEYAFEAFIDLGFAPLEAFALAAERVSPSALRELIRRGADMRTAASILL